MPHRESVLRTSRSNSTRNFRILAAMVYNLQRCKFKLDTTWIWLP